jgi:hypothetical protein
MEFLWKFYESNFMEILWKFYESNFMNFFKEMLWKQSWLGASVPVDRSTSQQAPKRCNRTKWTIIKRVRKRLTDASRRRVPVEGGKSPAYCAPWKFTLKYSLRWPHNEIS